MTLEALLTEINDKLGRLLDLANAAVASPATGGKEPKAPETASSASAGADLPARESQVAEGTPTEQAAPLDYETVKAAAVAYGKAHGRDGLVAKLKAFGLVNLQQAKPQQFGKLIAAFAMEKADA